MLDGCDLKFRFFKKNNRWKDRPLENKPVLHFPPFNLFVLPNACLLKYLSSFPGHGAWKLLLQLLFPKEREFVADSYFTVFKICA